MRARQLHGVGSPAQPRNDAPTSILQPFPRLALGLFLSDARRAGFRQTKWARRRRRRFVKATRRQLRKLAPSPAQILAPSAETGRSTSVKPRPSRLRACAKRPTPSFGRQADFRFVRSDRLSAPTPKYATAPGRPPLNRTQYAANAAVASLTATETDPTDLPMSGWGHCCALFWETTGKPAQASHSSIPCQLTSR